MRGLDIFFLFGLGKYLGERKQLSFTLFLLSDLKDSKFYLINN